jgi:hypothetical protein
VRRGLMAALLVSTGLLAVACGSPGASSSSSFHPGGVSSTPASSAASASQAGQPGADSLVMPPFGKNARIVVPPWLPASASEARAVITAKNFLLAVLYADYTGGQDHRWKAYVSAARVLSGLGATLAAPDVTTESFTGTIRISHMNAVAGTYGKNTVSVSFCQNSAHARNTSLSTGKVLPRSQQLSGNQNYYLNTYVLANNGAGRWAVISILPAIYYPEALECKP